MDKTEELRLIRKAVRGNPDAYGRLIVLYQEYLYKIAFLYMKNEQDALDLVGSTILKGFQNIRTLKKPEWFKTWLTRILINTAKDELKKIIYYDEIDEKACEKGGRHRRCCRCRGRIPLPRRVCEVPQRQTERKRPCRCFCLCKERYRSRGLNYG